MRIFLAVSLILNLASWLLIGFGVAAKDEVVLHYNVYFGADNTGVKSGLYAIPLAGLFCLALNFILVALALRKNQFAALVLCWGTIWVGILAVAATIALSVFNR